MASTITPRQKEIFEFITSFAEDKGYPPTIRDIASHFRIVSLNAVRVHLKTLEKKGFITLEKGRSRGINILRSSFEARHEMPILGKIAAGAPTLAEELREDSLDLTFWGKRDNFYLLQVKGDSMSPSILDGDMVVIKPQQHADSGDIVAALIDGEATVKQLILKTHRIVLHPLNPSYRDIEPGEECSINGKVVGLIRKYR